MDTQLWNAVDRRFRDLDIAGAIQLLEAGLAKEPTDRFKGLIGQCFTNEPPRVLSEIDSLVEACSQEFTVAAVYLEMNGFDINPDRWYFDSFAYSTHGTDPQDLDWLCDWQSPKWPQVTLEGLEAVQHDFAWYHGERIWKDKQFQQAYDHAVLLVMCKFVSLVESAVRAGNMRRPVPVLATAHDFDIVGRFGV